MHSTSDYATSVLTSSSALLLMTC